MKLHVMLTEGGISLPAPMTALRCAVLCCAVQRCCTMKIHVMLTGGGISLFAPVTALRRATQYHDAAP
jgi:hypothetical protein